MNEQTSRAFSPIPLVAPAKPRWEGSGPSNSDLRSRTDRAESMLRQAEGRIGSAERAASKSMAEVGELLGEVRSYKNMVDVLLETVYSTHVSHLESPLAPQRMVLGALIAGHLRLDDVAIILPCAFDAVHERVAFVSCRSILARGDAIDESALDRIAAAMGGLGASKNEVTDHREHLSNLCAFYLDTEREAVAEKRCGDEDSITPRLLREWHRTAWVESFVGTLINVGAKRYCYETIGEIREGVAELRAATSELSMKATRVMAVTRAFAQQNDGA